MYLHVYFVHICICSTRVPAYENKCKYIIITYLKIIILHLFNIFNISLFYFNALISRIKNVITQTVALKPIDNNIFRKCIKYITHAGNDGSTIINSVNQGHEFHCKLVFTNSENS